MNLAGASWTPLSVVAVGAQWRNCFGRFVCYRQNCAWTSLDNDASRVTFACSVVAAGVNETLQSSLSSDLDQTCIACITTLSLASPPPQPFPLALSALPVISAKSSRRRSAPGRSWGFHPRGARPLPGLLSASLPSSVSAGPSARTRLHHRQDCIEPCSSHGGRRLSGLAGS